eukprot:CAMPEP_0181485462 /NCGR_PEP_ID=MMETSP1110-20121109/46581_1 /TAXON_ID=174948 /ORGANISM="Symbiodinium sp., Strain CCMP421" /LENGTH=33 /DNA_ID= /DNA_START= /DNA_END= /DNA_ORIENTATION=
MTAVLSHTLGSCEGLPSAKRLWAKVKASPPNQL